MKSHEPFCGSRSPWNGFMQCCNLGAVDASATADGMAWLTQIYCLRGEGALLSWANIRASHDLPTPKGEYESFLCKLMFAVKQFCSMAKDSGASKIFSSLISALWWDCRTHFFVIFVHGWAQPHQTLGQCRWGGNIAERRCKPSESLVQSSVWRKAACQPWADMPKQC